MSVSAQHQGPCRTALITPPGKAAPGSPRPPPGASQPAASRDPGPRPLTPARPWPHRTRPPSHGTAILVPHPAACPLPPGHCAPPLPGPAPPRGPAPSPPPARRVGSGAGRRLPGSRDTAAADEFSGRCGKRRERGDWALPQKWRRRWAARGWRPGAEGCGAGWLPAGGPGQAPGPWRRQWSAWPWREQEQHGIPSNIPTYTLCCVCSLPNRREKGQKKYLKN